MTEAKPSLPAPTPADDDRALVRRARQGDRAAFTALVRLHQGRVRGFLSRYLRWPDVVDDLAQDVFLAALRDLGQFDEQAPLDAWLLGIARHRVLRYLRSDQRGRRAFEAVLSAARLERLESDDGLQQRRDEERLRRCLERMPPANRELVRRHYVLGERLADIAAATGRKEGAMRMMLLRIRQGLRACLEAQPLGDGT